MTQQTQQHNTTKNITLTDRFEFRDIHAEEADRGQGLAREIVSQYSKREKANQRKMLILTCLPEKVAMYEKMGLKDKGISGSSWGGEEWHEMTLTL